MGFCPTVHVHAGCLSDPGAAGWSSGIVVPQPGEYIDESWVLVLLLGKQNNPQAETWGYWCLLMSYKKLCYEKRNRKYKHVVPEGCKTHSPNDTTVYCVCSLIMQTIDGNTSMLSVFVCVQSTLLGILRAILVQVETIQLWGHSCLRVTTWVAVSWRCEGLNISQELHETCFCLEFSVN